MTKKEEGITPPGVLLAVLIALVFSGGTYYFWPQQLEGKQKAETETQTTNKTAINVTEKEKSGGTEEITIGSIIVDDNFQLQQSVDRGHQPWRLDPVEVARVESAQHGFSLDDNFSLISREYAEAAGTYLAEVEAVHNSVFYIVQLIQSEKQGEGGIWVINSISRK